MTDRETVIKALGCQIYQYEFTEPNMDCAECEYGETDCEKSLLRDAIRLLKADEQIGKGLGEQMDDVVRVTRCKDCKRLDMVGKYYYCPVIDLFPADIRTFFCARAERRETDDYDNRPSDKSDQTVLRASDNRTACQTHQKAAGVGTVSGMERS